MKIFTFVCRAFTLFHFCQLHRKSSRKTKNMGSKIFTKALWYHLQSFIWFLCFSHLTKWIWPWSTKSEWLDMLQVNSINSCCMILIYVTHLSTLQEHMWSTKCMNLVIYLPFPSPPMKVIYGLNVTWSVVMALSNVNC